VDSDHLSAVCRRRGIRIMLQFGSTVSGRSHPASDIDLAVLLARRPATLDEQVDVVADLQSLLPGREVDVALINGADPLFLKKITEQCRRLYGSPRALSELKIYAFKRYQDHRRFLAMERQYVSRRIRALAQ
jgi:predicted nucleotidyltransferase